jgi:hypothetical protein
VKQQREASRLPYDHYNTKLSTLKSQQKLLYNPQQYNRNKDKLALHEGNFRNLTTTVRLLCKEISQQFYIQQYKWSQIVSVLSLQKFKERIKQAHGEVQKKKEEVEKEWQIRQDRNLALAHQIREA